MVGTYDEIKVRKLYAYTVYAHMLDYIVAWYSIIFLVIIEFADKYMCICNNGENSKPPMHAASQYVTMVARLRDSVA